MQSGPSGQRAGPTRCVCVCAHLYNKEGMRDKQKVVQQHSDDSQTLTEIECREIIV